MRKHEFIDLLNYYFLDCDKDDLKGILADCEEQFRLGEKQGLSEEAVCCQLGHPKNIYRYYMGQPIVPEDNLSLNIQQPAEPAASEAPPRRPPQFYDWEKDRTQRRSPAAEKTPNRSRERIEPSGFRLPQQESDIGYDRRSRRRRRSGTSVPAAAKAIASPFLDIFGALLGIVSTLLFFVFALSLLASLAIYSLPPYLFSDLLPLPKLSVPTMACFVLSVLFAALAVSYASQACRRTARSSNGGDD